MPPPRSSPTRRRHTGDGVALVLLGAVLWGTTGTARALGPAAASALAVGTTRVVLGGALLALAAWWPRRPTSAGDPDAVRPARTLGATLVGAAGVAAYQVAFFAAVDVAGVALGTAVAIGSSPVFTGVIEWVVARRRPTGRWWLATGLAVSGVVVLAGPSAIRPAGVALALVAGAAYATYAVASKRLLDAGLEGRQAMGRVFGAGGLALLPLLAVVDLGWLADPAGLAMLVWLAAVTTLLAYLLFGAGLRSVAASTAATLSLAEPLTAAVLGVALLGERPSAIAVAGGALILAGLAALLLDARPSPPTRVPASRMR